MSNLNHVSSVFNGESKLSHNVRLGLIISIVVVLLIAITVLILSFLYKKKMTKKYLSPNEELEKTKLAEKNPNFGIVLNGIKKFYNNNTNDFFTCFVINTIYLNDYKNIYLEDNDNYLALSISNLANHDVIFNGPVNEGINNNIKKEFSDLSFEKITLSNKIENISELIIVLNSSTQSLEALIKSKINFLTENGIIIINNDYQYKTKTIKEAALIFNLRYETLKFKNKSVILLAKNNIKEIVEEGEKNGR
ncbi:Uncharacterised protein [Mycoplasmopsis arginini]|uniref:BC85_0335 family putative methyltransferase n=1 Tax=Mycoplasmopsis arginini TaxID=2094 RepID=UPI000A27C77B|nr:hypothetical protein [Mycoplasmopsis arginini]SGA02108.1 Uncharacterised protein [Chlamydia abortus]PWC08712.1 hypothetical protein DIE66_02840 [Mycoplasmopsis arginini]SGA06262.1 Uncharacterised protein [Mycoplasmopsis arginini]SGA29432.1 Uncharacterised protein [Mycoplasmopsis arginini]SGA31640.1 Uncharacterised protein [Chlamydia abortus]